jgi:serine/threonine protein kinase
MLTIGQHIDRYIVEGKLGEGGMAAVYRVRHETLHTAHALKVLTLADSNVRERLIREGRLQARLSHENVVQVTDVLTVAGQPGLLMEFVEGPTLEQWLGRYRPTLPEAETVFRALCTGVGFAHHKGLIHRDLKPSNVLLAVVDDRIVPKVADFGLARKIDSKSTGGTRAGAPLGTPGYMPPEQIRDASSVDRRADLWSLGCILYRMVCGVPAFEGDDLIELFAQVASADFVPSRRLRPDLPERIHVAIERTIRVALHERVADCSLLIDYLDGRRRELSLDYQPRALLPEPKGALSLSGCAEALEVARDIVAETTLGLPKLGRDSGEPRAASLDPVLPSKAVLGPAPAQAPKPKPKKPKGRYVQDRELDQPSALSPPVGVRRISVEADAPSTSRWWMMLPLAVLSLGSTLILLIAGGVMWWWLETSPPPPVSLPTVEDPVPAVVEPAPVPKRPRPPKPTSPGPAPATAPTVEEDPVPKASTGRVTFSGASELWLVGPSGEVRDLSKVPPGRYKVMAVFPAVGAVSAHGGVTVQAGEDLVLACVADFAQCKVR